jgi:hypothetical protein
MGPDQHVIWGWLQGKRPIFPSGVSLGMSPSMWSWLMQRERERNVAFAGGVRWRRSGGSWV